MSGIYIHIPFCKQACYYCDFHFSVNLKKKDAMLQAVEKELVLRREELGGEVVQSIYFGGGTPSLLSSAELGKILDRIYRNFELSDRPEITLEANPDDLDKELISNLKAAGINRLSIGIQSFFDEDLKLMNRAHNAKQARACLDEAANQFDNLSIDLIYGIPGMSTDRWSDNLVIALDYNPPHISSYALTVEPRTALKAFIEKGLIDEVDEELVEQQFRLQLERLQGAGYVHYEISNFGKADYFAINNTAYWQGKSYLGIGPSAHSYDGRRRSWNVRNNSKYIKTISEGSVALEREELSTRDRYNEYVMTGLRTIWGVSLQKVSKEFGPLYSSFLRKQAQGYIDDKLLYLEDDVLRATEEGKFLIDGIASHLFMLKLEK